MYDKLIRAYHQKTGVKRWFWWVLLFCLSIGAILMAYFRLRKQQEKLDRSKGDVARLKIEAANKERLFNNTNDRDALIELVKSYNELQHQIDLAERHAASQEVAFKKEFDQVKALESWQDLDEYNKRLR